MILRFVFSTAAGVINFVLGLCLMAALVAFGAFLKLDAALPSTEELGRYDPPALSRVYDSTGRLLDEFAEERRIFAPIEEIPEVLIQAIVSAEDKNFFDHQGYDPRAMAVALYEAYQTRGEDARGASTITQQVVKNFLLTNERSLERKASEIILAYRIEQTLTKDEILELYLNEIFLGQNSYGMAAAALTYFNAPLSEITLPQAAYLASLPKEPSAMHPVRQREKVLARRAYVLDQMARNGHITFAEAEVAKADPFDTVQSGAIRSYRSDIPPRGYFTDEIRRQVGVALGATAVTHGGLRIEATIDHAMQEAAQSALRDGLLRLDSQAGIWRGTGRTALPAADPQDPNRAVTLEEWASVLAAAPAARDVKGWMPAVVLRVDTAGAFVVFEEPGRPGVGFVPSSAARDWPRVEKPGDASPRAVGRLSDMLTQGDVVHVELGEGLHEGVPVLALRQVPMVEGAFLAVDVRTGRVLAVQGGFSFDRSPFNRATQALRQTGSSFKPFLYAAALEAGATAASVFEDVAKTIRVGTQSWTPKNASGRSYGRVTMRTAMERSLNLATLDIGQSIGMDAVAGMAERLGVYPSMARYPANMLGSQETTLFNMVRGYAAFASGGRWVDLTLVDRVADRHDATVFAPGPEADRPMVLSPVVAHQMTDMLRGVITSGTGSRVVLPDPVAGKTGTTNDAQDVWFVGYTPRIVAGCYIGFDRPQPLGPGAGGGSVCGPVFEAFMLEAMAAYPGGDFEAPEGGAYVGFDSSGNRVSGKGAVREFAPVDPADTGLAIADALAEAMEGEFVPGEFLPEEAPPIALPGHAPLLSPSEADKADRQRYLSIGTGGLY